MQRSGVSSVTLWTDTPLFKSNRDSNYVTLHQSTVSNICRFYMNVFFLKQTLPSQKHFISRRTIFWSTYFNFFLIKKSHLFWLAMSLRHINRGLYLMGWVGVCWIRICYFKQVNISWVTWCTVSVKGWTKTNLFTSSLICWEVARCRPGLLAAHVYCQLYVALTMLVKVM